jgi:signal transduction histidine kinase
VVRSMGGPTKLCLVGGEGASPLLGQSARALSWDCYARRIGMQTSGWIDLLSKLGGCAFRADPRTLRVTFVSAGAEVLTGYPRERWLAEPPLLRELFHPDDRDATLDGLRAAAEGAPRVLEHRLLTADGRTLFCRTAVRGSEGEDLLAVTIDTTLERIAEERRRESDARLLSLVENVPFDVWACDADGRCVMQNAASKANWGESLGMRPEELDVEPAMQARLAENARQALTGRVVRGEVTQKRAGKKPSTYFNIVAPILDGSQTRGLLGINIDVTDLREAERERDRLFVREQRARALAEIAERRNALLVDQLSVSLEELKKAQEALVKRERLAALGELASVVAHEVRNPLGAIFNSLGALRKMITVEGEAALLFEILQEEASRLNRIVVDMLDWVRPLQPMLQRQTLGPVVLGALRAAERAIQPGTVKAETKITVAADMPPVLVDDQLMHLALVNIISNSLQAMPRGGALTVEVRPMVRGDQVWAGVAVSDTGAGIAPEVVSRIFEPFFTTRASGTGLGLAVVKRIIDSHGGEIEVQSPPSAGATFIIRLRFAPERAAADSEADS